MREGPEHFTCCLSTSQILLSAILERVHQAFYCLLFFHITQLYKYILKIKTMGLKI